ncbi:metallopeptidase family protein [Rariglobus hedericola]|uniref:Metallopeptidase family protein n=1 Tax=Rariglobus hedericola TaxID=2597822 RepID=A0A556QIX0_9BACT|nr:metallopeptidase family protein [Rariglobus hedericola]TSJ76572.1 metallopeptidase family protein [Rariglobus hedericola]
MTLDRLTALASAVIEATQKKLPAELRDLAGAVPVHYEALPDAELIAEGFEDDILGLFTGSAYGDELREDQPMPAQIILFLENLWDFAEGDETIFRDEVRITYLHELGHYFGWDEDELAARELD